MDLFRTLFSKIGILIVVYLLLGVFLNTAPPHLPPGISHLGAAAWLHSWIQYFISIMTWPLSFWHPHFTTGRWHG